MSIRDEVQYRIDEGRLFSLPCLLPGCQTVRYIFVTEEVNDVFDPNNWNNDHDAKRFALLRANLDSFTQGQMITIANEPYRKPISTYMARTDPVSDELWDIRSRDPKPGVRVLGCFTEADVFVGLTWSFREPLGGPSSREWRDFIIRAKTNWTQLFGPYQPLKGSEISDYVSSNFYAV